MNPMCIFITHGVFKEDALKTLIKYLESKKSLPIGLQECLDAAKKRFKERGS